MFKIFNYPIFDDSESTRKAFVFYRLVLGSMIMVTILEIAEIIILPQNSLRWISIILLYDSVSFAFLYLNRIRKNELSFFLFIGFIYAMIYGMAWTAGGVKSAAVQISPVIIVMTGMLFDSRKGILVGFCVILGCLSLVIAESMGLLPETQVASTSFSLWINFSFYVALLALLQYYMVSDLNKILRSLKRELSLRQLAEKDLQKSETFRTRVFDSSRIPIIVMNAETLWFIDCNQAAIDIYGFKSRIDVLTKNQILVSAPEQYDGTPSSEKFAFYIEKAHKEGSVQFEWKHKRPNGESWDAEVFLMSFESEGKDYLQFTLLDITERKKTENNLKNTESRLKKISSNFKGGMIYQVILKPDKSRYFTYLSDSVNELYGISPEEGMADANVIYNRIYQDDLELLINAENDAIKTFSVFKCEVRMVDPSGEIRWSTFESTPRKMDDGSICWDGIEFVVTERKKTELALIDSEARYRFISENVDDVLWVLSLVTGKFTYCSPSVQKMRGFTAQEVMNQSMEEALTPQSLQDVMLLLNGAIANRKQADIGTSKYVSEIQQPRKDGTIVYAEASTSIVFNEAGQAIEVIGITREITERKISEQKLKESEERYRKLIESIPDIIMLSDEKGNILYGNEPFERITGIKPAEYFNPNRVARIHPDDLFIVYTAAQDLLNTDKIQTDVIENRFIDLWGNIHWFSGSMTKLKVNDKIVIQTVSRDITEKKRIEEELEKHKNQLELLVKERTEELGSTIEELHAVNEDLYEQKDELESTIAALHAAQNQLIQSEKMASLGLLSAGIAHEINNPLNFIHGGILGIENYLNEYCTDHYDPIYPLINAINIGVTRASEIVTSLSHYSRKDDLPFVECDIHSIIDNCLIMLQNQLKNKVEIQRKYSKKIQPIIANEGKLHQVILNIISNAEQSIENNGVITIETESNDSSLVLLISDTGCGISEENLQKIYDPFFTTKAPGKGTGLGLSITFNIIKEHNGTIHFESEINKGTTVTITLPIVK